jgi:dUTP pyrophosphatase
LSNVIPTGLQIALPKGWVAKIVPRSSIGMKTGLRLSNSVGVIDADYRGEIGVLYDNFSDSDYEIKAGDRIAQMWVEPVYNFKPIEVSNLPDTERGSGGFGSTGK